MGRDRLLADTALVDEHLHPGMIARLRLDAALPDVIEPRIAHVRPVRGRILHDARHAGGPRRLDQAARLGVFAEREVRVGDALLQEAGRVGELGLRLALERFGEELHGDLGGHLPVQMSAHAVGDHHEQGVAGVGVAGAVLVRLAASLAAFRKDRESHRPSRFFKALRTLEHLGVLFAKQHLLQSKHALRALHVIELQAPVDRVEQLPRILAVPHFRRGDVVVFLGAVVGRLRRRAGEAGKDARADGVAIAPGPEQFAVLVLLRRREARRIHRVQARALLGERLARGAEVDQHGRAVVADVDVGGLDVQMKELVRVHLPQPVQEQREHVADESFLDRSAARVDVLLQRAPAFVAHHHVYGLVRAKEIQHPHHVRMRQPRERAAFLEEAPHAVAERRQVVVRNRGQRVALFSQRELAREVFLDRDRLVVFVVGEIDDGKTPAREHARDAVVFELIAVRQRLIGLLCH